MRRPARHALFRVSRGVVALALLLALPARAAAPPIPVELTAAFVEKFAQFTSWPAEGRSPATLFCVVGDEPAGDAIAALTVGHDIDGRPAGLARVSTAQEALRCQVLFVGSSTGASAAPLLAAVREAPVLTIGDAPGFAGTQGVIGLRVEEKKLRFDISRKAAERAGLKLSSKLLALAHVVD